MNKQLDENNNIANILGQSLSEYSKINDDNLNNLRTKIDKMNDTKEKMENYLSEISNTDGDIMDTVKINDE